jgi:diaminohydroxyphosphoribosylaminopyrimidine deaminase/5-amino-6-(5-phosphoribosylamino)uracil reductase
MNHEFFMQQALTLAKKGWPSVSPNPMVGAVIVKDDKMVAEGYHEKFGGPHAEVNAIQHLPTELNAADCILYVTLEPCTHFGKTPPCADLVIKTGFKKVVIAGQDANPLVSGKGIEKLKEAGLEVVVNICKEEARELNRRFFTFQEKRRPYIILKWAQSADGFIARNSAADRNANIISGPESLKIVHQLRAETQAILVGKNTALADDPALTTRLVKGPNPIRILLDRNLEVPTTAKIYGPEADTVIFNSQKEGKEGHLTFVKSNGGIEEVTRWLYQQKIQSLLVEGGSRILTSFLEMELWDEVLVFQNPQLNFGSGVKAPVFAVKNTFEIVGNDKLYRHRRNETLSPSRSMPVEIF